LGMNRAGPTGRRGCGADGFPGFHPGLFSMAPSGSGARGALRFVRSQVSKSGPGTPSFVLAGPGHPPPGNVSQIRPGGTDR
jgi:hypothetical protein